MKGLVYIHVPKCGGSSFGAALRLRYLFSQASITLDGTDFPTRQHQLEAEILKGTKLITGHVPYAPNLHNGPGTGYAFITLLRHPVERFVSHYNYLQRHHPDPNRPKTLEAFLDVPDAARIASQYLIYFSGGTSCVDSAITNLSRFQLVGDLTQSKTFARELCFLTGTPLLRLHRNRAPERTMVPAYLAERISKLCAADLRIYTSFHGLRRAS